MVHADCECKQYRTLKDKITPIYLQQAKSSFSFKVTYLRFSLKQVRKAAYLNIMGGGRNFSKIYLIISIVRISSVFLSIKHIEDLL